MGYSVLKRCLLRRISPSLRSTWKRNSPAALRGSLDPALSPPGWRIPEQPQGETQPLGPSEVLERRLNSKPGAPRPGSRRREEGESCSAWVPAPRHHLRSPPLSPGPLRVSSQTPLSLQALGPPVPLSFLTSAGTKRPATSRRWLWPLSEIRRRLGPASACPGPPRGPQSTAEGHRRPPGSSSRATFVRTLQRKGCRQEPSLRSPQSQTLKAAPPGQRRRGYPPPSL